MSTLVSTSTPTLDLEHDEPTQFMLQLMQTSIKRRRARQANFFQKQLSFLFSPLGIILLIILLDPCVSIVYAMKNSVVLFDFLREFRKMLQIITNVFYGIFGLWFFSLLILPLPIKGGMLDLKNSERLFLSGLVGVERWSYINRKLEIEGPLKRLQVYLYYILPLLTALILGSLPFENYSKIVNQAKIIHFIIVIGIFSVLFVSILKSMFRTATALKLLIYKANWTALTQQLLMLSWVVWWFVMGIFGKIMILPDFGRDVDYIEMTFAQGYKITSIIVIICFAIIISAFKLFVNFKKIKRSDLIESRDYIKLKIVLYLSILLGFSLLLSELISKLLFVTRGEDKYIDLGDYLSIFHWITLVLLTLMISKWLFNSIMQNRLKIINFWIYLSSVILIIAFFFSLSINEVKFNEYKVFDFVAKYISIYVTLPSIWIFLDSSFADIVNKIATWDGSYSLKNTIVCLFQLYIVVSILPALFARFMENIALQVPARPKI